MDWLCLTTMNPFRRYWCSTFYMQFNLICNTPSPPQSLQRIRIAAKPESHLKKNKKNQISYQQEKEKNKKKRCYPREARRRRWGRAPGEVPADAVTAPWEGRRASSGRPAPRRTARGAPPTGDAAAAAQESRRRAAPPLPLALRTARSWGRSSRSFPRIQI